MYSESKEQRELGGRFGEHEMTAEHEQSTRFRIRFAVFMLLRNTIWTDYKSRAIKLLKKKHTHENLDICSCHAITKKSPEIMFWHFTENCSMCNYTSYMDYGGGDHWTADQGCVWLFGRRSKSRGRGLSIRPIGCTPALSVTQHRCCSYICPLWHYISVMPLPFSPF